MKTDTQAPPNHCAPCQFAGDLGKSVLNSLSAHIAILDTQGVIIETNRAWQAFAAAANASVPYRFIGLNYLKVCDAASGEGADDAQAVAAGIRAVIGGQMEEFLYDYPCHSPTGQHWFYLRAIRMETHGPTKVIVSHEEITQLKLIEEALKQSKKAVEEQKQNLEEANIALKVLLKQRESDKLELEQKVLANLKDLVFPYVEKLKRAPLRPKDKTTVEIIERHLNDIVSPLLQRLSNVHIVLTPHEMQIAALVKDGRSSKEIAEILTVSETTVHFHRKNLRQKLGIKNDGTNLRSLLLSLS
jgi:DNA-binding CsgD family transcriptional regulator